jgi:hypothetical protein
MQNQMPKRDLSAYGYADGNGFFYCTDCGGTTPIAGHQHAFRCVHHAIKAEQNELASLPPAETLQVVEAPVITCSQSGFMGWLVTRFLGR